MDLCGDMLLAYAPPSVAAERCCPPFRRVAMRMPVIGSSHLAFNADRVLNRFLLFPREARRIAKRFDCFHVVDHSYAHLAHALPADRTGVYCHDLDAFRCLLEPAADRFPGWFRMLARRALSGLQRAAIVFHSTEAVKQEITRAGLIDPARLVHAPCGPAAEFTAQGDGGEPLWLQRLGGSPWVAHVGSCIPRKRVDVLLEVVAAVRTRCPQLKLVKVGGEWSSAQHDRIARHRLEGAIVHVHNLPRETLAAVYRQAGAVLVPSEAEGFGLPVIEALACGAPVVASDIAVLREVGGNAALYAPVADVGAWADTVAAVLTDPAIATSRAERLAWAARFSWAAHAQIIAGAYLRLGCASPS